MSEQVSETNSESNTEEWGKKELKELTSEEYFADFERLETEFIRTETILLRVHGMRESVQARDAHFRQSMLADSENKNLKELAHYVGKAEAIGEEEQSVSEDDQKVAEDFYTKLFSFSKKYKLPSELSREMYPKKMLKAIENAWYAKRFKLSTNTEE